MLRARVLTALALLALLLPALSLANPLPLALLLTAFVGAAAWEWLRLNPTAAGPVAFGWALALGFAALGLGLQAQASAGSVAQLLPGVRAAAAPLWMPAALAWALGLVLVLRAGVPAWPRLPWALRGGLGLALLGVAWAGLLSARAEGLNFLLSTLALVWAADIAAYFGGRRWGRRKLAPTISPGKSWEGVWSGGLGVLLLALAWILADRLLDPGSLSLYSRLLDRFGPLGLLPALAALTAFSVAGDLFESLVKRSAGAKDSSGLLPGHGGVLDRIDALLPVLPLALALATR